jgi:uncharacterized damage-inducible protein DinB
MTLTDIQLLYEFNYWAKSRLLQSLDAMPENNLYKELTSSFPSIHATVVHTIGAEDIWLQRFTGQGSHPFLSVKDLPTYAEAKSKWSRIEKEMLSHVGLLNEGQLNDVVTFKTAKGEDMKQIRWQALQHLVNHDTYHRGQITTMIRQVGGTPVSTDLIRFYREKK